MSDESAKFAVIITADQGVQLYNITTDEVADLAVLEDTWRPAVRREESEVQGVEYEEPTAGLTSFGSLRMLSLSAENFVSNFNRPAILCNVS